MQLLFAGSLRFRQKSLYEAPLPMHVLPPLPVVQFRLVSMFKELVNADLAEVENATFDGAPKIGGSLRFQRWNRLRERLDAPRRAVNGCSFRERVGAWTSCIRTTLSRRL